MKWCQAAGQQPSFDDEWSVGGELLNGLQCLGFNPLVVWQTEVFYFLWGALLMTMLLYLLHWLVDRPLPALKTAGCPRILYDDLLHTPEEHEQWLAQCRCLHEHRLRGLELDEAEKPKYTYIYNEADTRWSYDEHFDWAPRDKDEISCYGKSKKKSSTTVSTSEDLSEPEEEPTTQSSGKPKTKDDRKSQKARISTPWRGQTQRRASPSSLQVPKKNYMRNYRTPGTAPTSSPNRGETQKRGGDASPSSCGKSQKRASNASPSSRGQPKTRTSDASPSTSGQARTGASDASPSSRGETQKRTSDASPSSSGQTQKRASYAAPSSRGQTPKRTSDASPSSRGQTPKRTSDASPSSRGQPQTRTSNAPPSSRGQPQKRSSDASPSSRREPKKELEPQKGLDRNCPKTSPASTSTRHEMVHRDKPQRLAGGEEFHDDSVILVISSRDNLHNILGEAPSIEQADDATASDDQLVKIESVADHEELAALLSSCSEEDSGDRVYVSFTDCEE